MITNTTVLDIHQATPEELPLVMEILGEAAAWLEDKGIYQWPSPPNEHWWRRTAGYIDQDEVYLVGIVKNIFATVRLSWQDGYWPDDGTAVYVHSMAVRSAWHGQRVGSYLLGLAAMKAYAGQKQFLRLDCLASNGRLRQYYEEQGFSYRGEVTDQDYVAVLYEIDYLAVLSPEK